LRFVVITGPLPPKKLPEMLRQRELQSRATFCREQMQQNACTQAAFTRSISARTFPSPTPRPTPVRPLAPAPQTRSAVSSARSLDGQLNTGCALLECLVGSISKRTTIVHAIMLPRVPETL